jgi:hypothetical protein
MTAYSVVNNGRSFFNYRMKTKGENSDHSILQYLNLINLDLIKLFL